MASVVLHVLILALFFATSLTKNVIQPQIISVTLHQEMETSYQGPSSVSATDIREQKIDEIDVRRIPDRLPEKADDGRPITAQESSSVIIQKTSASEVRHEKNESGRAAGAYAADADHSLPLSFPPGPAKAEGMQKNGTQQVGDTLIGQRGAPYFIHQEVPVYPALARRLGMEGRVLLKLLIDANGKLLKVEVIESAGYGFTEASIEAVKKSTYAPGVQDGVRVATRALLPVRFRLQ